MRSNFIIIILCTLFSCAHTDQIVEKNIVKGSCESEFQKAKISNGKKILSNIAEVTGTTASYTITGLGYSTDMIIKFGGGIMFTAIICSPLIAVDLLNAKNNSSYYYQQVSPGCIEKVGALVSKDLNPSLGPNSYKGTASWRCPNVDSIAKGLTNVATCYEKNGEKNLALRQLNNIKATPIFDQCLSSSAKLEIETQLSLI